MSAGIFDDIGRGVGGFFRGVGGIFGQGLAGFAQPMIEESTNQFQRTAIGVLQEADRAAGRRIDQLSEKLSHHIDQADGILQERLQQLDEILGKKLGAIDIIGTKQIFIFEQSIISIVKYASMLFLVTALLVVVASYLLKRLNTAKYDQFGVRPIATSALALCILSGVGLLAAVVLRPPSQGRLLEIKADLIKSYQFALQLGDLSGATFYASQVNVLDSSNLGSRLLVEMADLQRDLLSRPALLKSTRGSLELAARAARLDRTGGLIANQGVSFSDMAFIAHELPATAAMIGWQSAQKEEDETISACAALHAPTEFGKSKVKAGDASPFVWLSYSYARWATVRMPQSGYKCADGKTIKDTLATAQPILASFAQASPNPVIQQAVLYNTAASIYYEKASVAYTSLLISDTQARWKSAYRPQYVAERDKAADALAASWSEFLKVIRSIPGIQGSNIVLALNGMPLALAQRAVFLKGADPAAARPLFDLAACNAAVTDMGSSDIAKQAAAEVTRYGQFLSLFDHSARFIVCAEQAKSDARIAGFENAIATAATTPGKDPYYELRALLHNPELASFATSLTGCLVVEASIGGERGCRSGEKPTVGSLASWLRGNDPTPLKETANQRVAFVR